MKVFLNRHATRLVIGVILVAIIPLVFLLDGYVAEFLARPIKSGQVKAALAALRCWGEGITVVFLAAGFACVTPRRALPIGLALVLTLAASSLVNVVKTHTGRPRPSDAPQGPTAPTAVWTPGPEARNSSFPSGHTTTAFTFGACLAALEPRLAVVCAIAASGTGLSRMYEQRHWLSDCYVAALFGWFVVGGVFRFCLKRMERPSSPAGHGSARVNLAA